MSTRATKTGVEIYGQPHQTEGASILKTLTNGKRPANPGRHLVQAIHTLKQRDQGLRQSMHADLAAAFAYAANIRDDAEWYRLFSASEQVQSLPRKPKSPDDSLRILLLLASPSKRASDHFVRLKNALEKSCFVVGGEV